MTAFAHTVAQLAAARPRGHGGRPFALDADVRRRIVRLVAAGGLSQRQIAEKVGGGAKRYHVAEIIRRARKGRGHLDA